MRQLLSDIKNVFVKNRRTIADIFIFIGFVLLLIFLFVAVVNWNIVLNTNDSIYSTEELVSLKEEYDCIIVLGAGVRADGTPTDMLRDRLITAYEAYKNGNSPKLLLSGDSEASDYTETVTMKKFLMEKGVPESAIVSDGYGLSTYESIWRAKNIYKCNKILIISQKYHLHRAIYIAEELGMEAHGIDAALESYRKQPIYDARECLARIKDMIYAEMGPDPKYTDEWESFE